MEIRPLKSFKADLDVPGDKSIFHRAAILAALSDKTSIIKNIPLSQDANSTIKCLRALGARIDISEKDCRITGLPAKPAYELNAGNSGTSLRLLSGVLAAQPFASSITGDESLLKRPMRRIIEPLTEMGAKISHSSNYGPPLKFYPSRLTGINYTQRTASAQVKSCFLFAALIAEGKSSYIEKKPTRDHLEKLLVLSKAAAVKRGEEIEVVGSQAMNNFSVTIPGDFSSASFFILGAIISQNGKVTIKNVGVNPLRIGLLKALKRMGANIEISCMRKNEADEPICDITAYSSKLRGISIGDQDIPSIIDELPLLAVAAIFARGQTKVTGASELRVKECDRIKAITREFTKLGAFIKELPDGFEIEGEQTLKGGIVDSHGDHRIAMSLAIAATRAESASFIRGLECSEVSFPEFQKTLKSISCR